MIIDTSAIIAILRDEPRQRPVRARLLVPRSAASVRLILLNPAVVIDASRDPIATRRFDDFS